MIRIKFLLIQKPIFFHKGAIGSSKMFSHTKIQNTLLVLSYFSLASATFNCDVHIDGKSFDLSPLNGTHQLSSNFSTPPSTSEYLWVFDPCGVINRDNKDISGLDQCPEGSQSEFFFSFSSSIPIDHLLTVYFSLRNSKC